MSHTAIQEIPTNPWMVDAIINRDIFGYCAGVKIILQTVKGNTYEITILKGVPLPVPSRGRGTLLRKVDFLLIDRFDNHSLFKGHFLHLTGVEVPKINFYSELVENEDLEKSRMSRSLGTIKPEMTLVIDWSKLVTLDTLGV